MASVKIRSLENSIGFVLHSYPYKETSMIIDTFTKSRGRVSLLAKGAKRPGSVMRSVLLPFQPVFFEWTGRNELKILRQAEWLGGFFQLSGLPLLCGFYLNELIMKFLPKDDPSESLYEIYGSSINDLRVGNYSKLLRKFEKCLLREIGYALILDRDSKSGKVIDPGRKYFYVADRGPLECKQDKLSDIIVSGKTLLDMIDDDYSDPKTLTESKLLMRYVINYHLGGKILHTRRLLFDLNRI